MIIRPHDLLVEVHFAEDEQEALVDLGELIYEEAGFIYLPALPWSRRGAAVYRVTKALARGLKKTAKDPQSTAIIINR